jgi:iron complex outermembrane recepter protein
MKQLSKRLGAALLLSVSPLACAAWAQTAPAAAGGAAKPPAQVDEVVVTATKRSLRLQDAPLAVSAVTGDILKEKGAISLVDYARSVPGLSFTDIGAGRQRLSIRGIDSKIGSPVVGYYIGESPIPGSRGTIPQTVVDPQLFDIDRVEVLRGPQGTLYGSGSMGGTVKVVPKRPDLDAFGYEVDATGQATQATNASLGYNVNALVNAPIVKDRVAARIVGWWRDDGGFIDRRVDGVTVKRNVPTEKTYGVRATVDVAVNSQWTVSASAFYQNQKFNGFQDITTGANNPGDKLQQNFLFNVDEFNGNEFGLYNVLVEGDLGFAKLVSSTSYFDGRQIAKEETGATLAENLGVASGYPITERNSNKDFTQEIRLTSARPVFGFSYLVGAFFNTNQGTRHVDYTIPNFSTDFFPVAGDNLFTALGDYHSHQTALFGELSYTVAKKLTLTAGLRWFDAFNSSQEPQNGLFAGDESATAPKLSDAPKLTATSRDVVYKFNASWKLNDDHMVYAQASEGFRPGIGQAPLPATLCNADMAALGIANTPRQLNADKLWNYEVGAKSAFAERRVQTTLAVYEIDWQSIQQSVFLNCGFRVYVNGPSVRNRGVEGEVNVRATSALRLGGSLAYVSSAFLNPLLGLAGTQGKPVPDTPKWTASAYADYRKPLWADWDGDARLDYSFTDGSISAYGVTGITSPDKKALSLVDVRFGARRRNLEVALFVHNLLNDVERTALADSLSANLADRLRYSVNRPRTVGVNVDYRY